jgi:hypothetical protein
MHIDPMRVVAFFHVLLLVYWLGGDLGVMITGAFAGAPNQSPEARRRLQEASALIDMAPRTCLVLIIPVGLTLASQWGLPVTAPGLALAWVVGLAWTCLVWMVHLQHGSPLGKLLWKVDLGLRIVAMSAFMGFGGYCLAKGAPISEHWLAAKFVLFGFLIFLGVVVRIMLLTRKAPVPAAPADPSAALPFWTPLRNVVFGIWALVAVMAFLGIVKPF